MELSSSLESMTKNMAHDDRSSRTSSSSGGSPSVPYEKCRMLDITRDKPIKVAVRVAVPVRDHPKFNFVGKLLGPKGNSMKRLQEETMCKMAILGRGSMRDRKKEEELRLSGDSRYTHLSDDLHVEISTFAAPAEAHARIAYALAEVRRFLIPDYHDDIRQEQMWEMQAINSTSTTQQNGELQIDQNDILKGETKLCEDSEGHIDCDLNSTMSMDIPTAAQSVSTNNHNHSINHCTTMGNNGISTTDIDPQTVTIVETPNVLLHPALRGVKTVNLGGNMARKRPLLGAPRTGMNPTKRTVMTLLARARTAQSLHGARTTSSGDAIQVITSPLILQQHDVLQTNGNGTVTTIQKENILQGA